MKQRQNEYSHFICCNFVVVIFIVINGFFLFLISFNFFGFFFLFCFNFIRLLGLLCDFSFSFTWKNWINIVVYTLYYTLNAMKSKRKIAHAVDRNIMRLLYEQIGIKFLAFQKLKKKMFNRWQKISLTSYQIIFASRRKKYREIKAANLNWNNGIINHIEMIKQ